MYIFKSKDTDAYFPETLIYFNTEEYAVCTASVILNRFITGAVLCNISSKLQLWPDFQQDLDYSFVQFKFWDAAYL